MREELLVQSCQILTVCPVEPSCEKSPYFPPKGTGLMLDEGYAETMNGLFAPKTLSESSRLSGYHGTVHPQTRGVNHARSPKDIYE